MRYKHWTLCWALVTVGIVGCGGADATSNAPPAAQTQEQQQAAPAAAAPSEPAADPAALEKALAATTADPAGAVATFLDAVRRGDDAKTAAMFTPLARERVHALGIQVAPPGSDTAKFEVGQVEMLAEDGARVQCTWSDVDPDGNERTDEITWMVRKEQEGWRVAGMAAMVFPGEPPVLLDFERPQETLEKMQKLKEEIRRRQESLERQAQRPEETENSVQR